MSLLDHHTTFVFDLDGTLIDSLHDVAAGINAALVELGFEPLKQGDMQCLIGPDLAYMLPIVMARVAPEKPFYFAAFHAVFCRHYTTQQQQTRLYAGVEKTLRALRQHKKAVHVLTNKPAPQAHAILTALGVRDLIGEVIGPDTFKRPKPDPVGLVSLMQRYQVAEDKMVMIGDTEIDIKTAHQAGVTAVAVTYGYRTQAQLASENPHFYSSHPQDILTL